MASKNLPGDHVFEDVFGDEVILAAAIREIILSKHPEAGDFVDHIGKVLREPDEVRRSVSDERVALYYRYDDKVLGGKWIAVVVKKADRKYVSTIYATDRIKSGELIWKR